VLEGLSLPHAHTPSHSLSSINPFSPKVTGAVKFQ
jgi:hypothetical protein